MNTASKYLACFVLVCSAIATTHAQSQEEILEQLLDQIELSTQEGQPEKVLGIAREAIDLAEHLQDTTSTITAHLAEARGLVAKGEPAQARQSLSTIQPWVDHYSEEQQVAYYLLEGEALLLLGRTDEALQAGEEALQKVLAMPSHALDQEAAAHSFLGVVFWNQGDYERARDEHQEALILREQVFGASSAQVAGSFINLGLVDASEENWPAAADAYRRAINALEAADAIHTRAFMSAQTNLGVAYLLGAEARLDDAELAFRTARSAWANQLGAGHPNVLFLDAYLARIDQARGDFENALERLAKVREGYAAHYQGHHPELANAWNLTGQIHVLLGEYDEAIAAHQQALVTNHEDFNPADDLQNPAREATAFQKELVVSTLQFKAKALEARYFGISLKKKDLEQALNCIQAANARLQVLRQQRVREADQLALGNLAAGLFEDGVRICEGLAEISLAKESYWKQGFRFAEASKAAVLQQSIAESNAKSYAGIPDSLLARERELTTQIAYYEQRLAQDPYHPEVGTWFTTLAQLRRGHDRFISTVERDFPEYHSLKYQSKELTVEELQGRLATGTAMLSYFVRPQDQRLSIFLLTAEEFKVVNLSLDQEFNDWIAGMRNHMVFNVSSGYGSVMYPLYQQLFPRALRIPREVKQLIIVPHRQLSLIPWEALLTKSVDDLSPFHEYPYLIKNYGLQYSYSAGLYAQLQDQGAAQGTEGMYMMAPVEFENFGLASLPGTLLEVNNISKVTAASEMAVTARTDAEASELIFRLDALDQYPIVHLATHGVIDADKPALSRLYLSIEDEENAQADGELFTGDIYGLSLDAELVALSACETGLGKLQTGEGLLGLTRAFLFAGSRRLLVSLWTVSDQSTAQLATQFYYYALQEQQSYSEAIRQSKLELINGQTYAAPYYWAPFVLVGK
ncbi:MAG: CHAT domain-containing tetratricopeptide repeat protein [Bacteroidota bacterium]